MEYQGEIGDGEKGKFLGCAIALLFPIDWEEPFGLVMIESFACGTPVVAYRRGSVPEVIEDGVTGFVVSNLSEAVEAVKRVGDIDRSACRRCFEERFTVARMASEYARLYRDISGERRLVSAV